ncbi:hypothetical protein HMPREF3034_01926 [Prevotella sp. DNF00663]|nr:hypothetical protein HMPREF3034_01926 [Prevotella sp. DNF00663]
MSSYDVLNVLYTATIKGNLAFAKIMQMSAMRIYSQIAECSLSYAKIMLFKDK